MWIVNVGRVNMIVLFLSVEEFWKASNEVFQPTVITAWCRMLSVFRQQFH